MDRMFGPHRIEESDKGKFFIWDSDPSKPFVSAKYSTKQHTVMYVVELNGICE